MNAYGRKAFADECRKLRAVTEDRNNALNDCAFRCWQLVAGGNIPAEKMTELEAIALEIGLDHSEVRATMDSARRGGEQAPRGGNGDRPTPGPTPTKKSADDERKRAAEWAASILKASRKLGGHPYLARKKILAPETLHVINADQVHKITGWNPVGKSGRLEGSLIVAALRRPGEAAPCQVQLIDGEGRKAFLKGNGTLRGASCNLNNPDNPACIIIGEGIATTKTGIDAMAGAMGIVAMASVNLVRTAEATRAKYPEAEIIVLADLDRKTGAPDKHALDAARAVRGRCAIPSFPAREEEQTDINDMAQVVGMDEVAECIRRARAIEPEPDQAEGPAQDTGTTRDNAGTMPGQKRRFLVYTHENIDALPDTAWTVKNILPDIGVGALHGESTVGKSFLALDLAAAITEGRDWFGHRTRPRPVAYLVLEGIGGFKKRLRAYEIAHGRKLPNKDLHIIGVDPVEGFDIRNTDHCVELSASLPADCIIVVDTLSQAALGRNENTSEDGGKVLAGARVLAGASRFVLFVAHCGKDQTRGISGWYGFFAALDMNIEVTRQGSGYVWTAKKVKDGMDGIKGHFKRDVVELGEDTDGEEITSCVIRPDDSVRAEAAPREKMTTGMQIAVKAFENCVRETGIGGAWRDEWKRHFFAISPAENDEAKKKAFNRAVDRLVTESYLEANEGFFTRAGVAGTFRDNSGTVPGQS